MSTHVAYASWVFVSNHGYAKCASVDAHTHKKTPLNSYLSSYFVKNTNDRLGWLEGGSTRGPEKLSHMQKWRLESATYFTTHATLIHCCNSKSRTEIQRERKSVSCPMQVVDDPLFFSDVVVT